MKVSKKESKTPTILDAVTRCDTKTSTIMTKKNQAETTRNKRST
ncbi:MAG: hypothetical protein QW594_04010 [Candidatus Woesearchaeota archaeon]